MRKLGMCQKPYLKKYNNAAAFSEMKKQGFETVDYSKFVETETDFFKLDDDSFLKEIENDKKSADDADLIIYQVHGPWRYPPRDSTEEEREERFEKMSKAIYGTAALDCKYMAIHPIMPFGADSDPEPEKLIDMNLEFFNKLLSPASKAGVVLCIENMPMTALSISSPEAILNFIKLLNSPYAGICLDTGHSNVMGVSPSDAIRILGNTIKIMHVHDNNGIGDFHKMPFEGTINWNEFSNALCLLDESIPLSLETSIPDLSILTRIYNEILIK